MTVRDFDERARIFTREMTVVADWKENFPGATHATRLQAAIIYAESAIERVKHLIKSDEA